MKYFNETGLFLVMMYNWDFAIKVIFLKAGQF